MNAEIRQEPKGLRATLDGTCIVGRSPEADLKLFSQRVSREHAMIREQAGGFWLYDLNSANGTFLNDREVKEPVQLRDGDAIHFADTIFRFHQAEGIDHSGPALEDQKTVIGVQKTPILVLVSDIVNFSGLSERLSEEHVASILNAWYESCQSLIAPTRGSIDKFMGDGMFAYWRTTDPEARSEALSVARSLATGLESVHPEIESLFQREHVHLQCGVGLHLGNAAVGAVTRGTRTALGDTVNIAFRIESMTRALGHSVLASREFFSGWDAGLHLFTNVGIHHLKGYSEPVELFALNEAAAA